MELGVVLYANKNLFNSVLFDQKRTFVPHLPYLTTKCLKAVSLLGLRVEAHTSWEVINKRCSTSTKVSSDRNLTVVVLYMVRHEIFV